MMKKKKKEKKMMIEVILPVIVLCFVRNFHQKEFITKKIGRGCEVGPANKTQACGPSAKVLKWGAI